MDDLPEGAYDLVDLHCPDCGEVREHAVLRAAAANWTLRCERCKKVRTMAAPKQPRMHIVPVILSEGPTSRNASFAVELDGTVGIDDEFDLEGRRIRVTAVESLEGMRPKRLKSREVKTVYAVLFDTVNLHYTVNQGELTRAFQESVSPEEEIHVGTVREVQGVRLAIKTLKSDQNRTLHRGFLYARNVTRVFADLASDKAKPGSKVRTRSRGAGPWGSQGAGTKDRRPRGLGSRRK
ncbi:MAG: HVO_0476 family zinc finger protein [Candidatus Thermoplasmatota archaeon]